MPTIPSPNMLLPVPIVGVDPGPDYATNVNSCFFFIDTHDHTAGKGVKITPNGLDITSALTFANNPATNLSYVNFQAQPAVTVLRSVYVVGNDLFYKDGAGASIQITASGGVAGTPGSIGGLTGGASCSYSGAQQAFIFSRNGTQAANIDVANVILRNLTAPYPTVTIAAPLSLPTSYTVTYPSSLPPVQRFATLDNTGAFSAPWAVDDFGIEVSGGTTIQLKDLGVTLAKLAAAVAQSLNPAGTILTYAGNVNAQTDAPAGYLFCNGDAVSRTTYAALFNALSPSQSCNTTNANATVTVASSANLRVGMAVFGAGIPNNTVINTISNATTIIISQNATATQTGVSLRFGGYGQGDLSTTFNLPDFRGRFLRGVDMGTARDPDRASRTTMNTGGNTGDAVGSIQSNQIQTHTHGITVYDGGTTTDSGIKSSAYFGGVRTGTTLGGGGNETRPLNAYVNYIIKT